jgi:hypothetical protein
MQLDAPSTFPEIGSRVLKRKTTFDSEFDQRHYLNPLNMVLESTMTPAPVVAPATWLTPAPLDFNNYKVYAVWRWVTHSPLSPLLATRVWRPAVALNGVAVTFDCTILSAYHASFRLAAAQLLGVNSKMQYLRKDYCY